MVSNNGWGKINVDAIDTTETPLSGPGARTVFLKVVQIVNEEVVESVAKAVRVQLRDGRQGFVRVLYGMRYYDPMSLIFHPLDGIEVVRN